MALLRGCLCAACVLPLLRTDSSGDTGRRQAACNGVAAQPSICVPAGHLDWESEPPPLSLLALDSSWRRVDRRSERERGALLDQTPLGSGYVSPVGDCEGFDCLRKYVDLRDSTYTWYDTGYRFQGRDQTTGLDWRGYVLNMTSGTWLNAGIVQWPTCSHLLIVVVPDRIDFPDFAILHLAFGIDVPEFYVVENRGNAFGSGWNITATNLGANLPLLDRIAGDAAYLATHVGVVAATLLQIENEAQVFATDPEQLWRVQNALDAYARLEFLRHVDQPERLLELPMVRAASRAMDTLANFTGGLRSGRPVRRFGVLGYSKLGRTVWQSVVDPRVEAIVPVNSCLGEDGITNETMHKLLASEGKRHGTGIAVVPRLSSGTALFGETSSREHPLVPTERYPSWDEMYGNSAFADLDGNSSGPEKQRMVSIIDPINYLEDLRNVRKFYLQGTNDVQYSGHLALWWPLLPGSKQLLFVNSTHESTLALSLAPIGAFFLGHLRGERLPVVEWFREERKPLWVIKGVQESGVRPVEARLWFAHSNASGDLLSAAFRATAATLAAIAPGGGAAIEAAVPPAPPSSRRTGAFIDVSYPSTSSAGDAPRLSSPMFIFERW